MRAEKHLVLPDEDAAEFAELAAALSAELAPIGALQSVLARRVAIAAWRLARADRMEAELFVERHVPDGGLGLALIRDGNGTRSFETLLRYRGAAMAEFWRALRTLKALQAEQAALREQAAGTDHALDACDETPAALTPAAPMSDRSGQSARQSDDSGRPRNRKPVVASAMPNEPEAVRMLPETATRWHRHAPAAERNPDEPRTRGIPRETARHAPPYDPGCRTTARRPVE